VLVVGIYFGVMTTTTMLMKVRGKIVW